MEHQPVPFVVIFILYLVLPASFCTGYDDDAPFVYSGFAGAGAGAGAANPALSGTATITSEGLLELTDNEPTIKGHAFYPTPFQFKKQPNGTVQSFSVAFVFAIVSPYSDVSTDGMAFVITPNKSFSGAPSQYLGLLNSSNDNNPRNHMFAIELDTAQNLELDDINGYHVGIDINSLHSKESRHVGFYDDEHGDVFKNLTLTGCNCKPIQVWVDYNKDATQIIVTLAPIEVAKPRKPLLSVTYNLSTVLTEQAYIGFSAATGPITSQHYVLGWSFAMDASAPAIEIARLPKLPCSRHSRLQKVLQITLPIVVVVLIFATIILLMWRQRLRYAEVREDWEVEFGPHRFSYKDLFSATEGFKNKHILGMGGFGKVYKGVLPTSKLEVAVKRVSHGSNQGMKEFISEVVSIGHLRHRNLVQLLGYCRRKGELLLVYDYMSNGSLDKYLYGEENKPILNWAQRLQIIKDVASGLFYLHEKWEKVVIHRDIKSSNVLLDGEMNARLGDFGLARLYEHGSDPQTTHLVGTMGFIAPELARTGKASPLTDVFAFGTFLLEVTCGHRPISNSVQHGRKMLVDWVLEHWHRGSLLETVDARLNGSYNDDEACLVLRLGLMCSHPFPSARPIMRQVMQYLDGDVPLPELTPPTLSSSLLAMMQGEGFSPYAAQYPWSVTSLGTMTPNISAGR